LKIQVLNKIGYGTLAKITSQDSGMGIRVQIIVIASENMKLIEIVNDYDLTGAQGRKH